MLSDKRNRRLIVRCNNQIATDTGPNTGTLHSICQWYRLYVEWKWLLTKDEKDIRKICGIVWSDRR